MSRNSYTQYVGDGGIIGARTVRPGGKIKLSKEWLQDEKLLPFVGNIVCFWDSADGCVQVYVAKWPGYSTIRKHIPRPHAGGLIVKIEGIYNYLKPT